MNRLYTFCAAAALTGAAVAAPCPPPPTGPERTPAPPPVAAAPLDADAETAARSLHAEALRQAFYAPGSNGPRPAGE